MVLSRQRWLALALLSDSCLSPAHAKRAVDYVLVGGLVQHVSVTSKLASEEEEWNNPNSPAQVCKKTILSPKLWSQIWRALST